MDARTRKHSQVEHDDPADEARVLAETITAKRDRLLAGLTLVASIGLVVALPFALRSGAEFFMPVTAALVVAIALVPLLEWFERRGIPSKLSAGLCVIIFLAIALFARERAREPAADLFIRVQNGEGCAVLIAPAAQAKAFGFDHAGRAPASAP